jgi:hypothetical protein
MLCSTYHAVRAEAIETRDQSHSLGLGDLLAGLQGQTSERTPHMLIDARASVMRCLRRSLWNGSTTIRLNSTFTDTLIDCSPRPSPPDSVNSLRSQIVDYTSHD